MLYYLIVYFIMNFGAFFCVQLIENRTGRCDIGAFRGLIAIGSPSRVSADLVVAMILCLMSLTGIPFLAGFIGKFILFGVLIEARTAMHVTLALIGVFNSVVSLYYYFRIAKAMTLEKAEEDVVGRYSLPFVDRAILWAVSAGLLFFFFLPDGLRWIAEASRMALAAL
jgi:NADH-quinone oxidoreductase subunit N